MRRTVLLAAALLLAPVGAASAQVIIGNMPQTNDNTQTADIDNLRQKAHRFIMQSDSLIAGDLILRLRNYDTFGEITVELRDSMSSTAPGGNVLLTFNAATPGGLGIFDYTFTPTSFFELQPFETYWIVVRGDVSSSVDWMASSPSVTPTGLAQWGSSSFTTNGGGTWSNSSILTTFQFNVGIPAPGAIALLGLAGLTTTRRRRRA